MKERIKNKWVKALRSGEYKQGQRDWQKASQISGGSHKLEDTDAP